MFKVLVKVFLFFLILSIPIMSNQVVFEKDIFKLNFYQRLEKKITGFFEKGENLYILFRKFNISDDIFLKFKEKIGKIFDLKGFKSRNKYEICIEKNNELKYFYYWIDNYFILKAEKKGDEINVKKEKIDYEIKYIYLKGIIDNNLISSLKEEDINVALDLSEIFSSDIDFWTDLRKGDWFKIIIEGLYLEKKFKLYGRIIFAEFFNDGKNYKAYYFEEEDGYFDENGKSKIRAFLRTPMNFKKISSRFSFKRYHPILKIYRPHHGTDFVAPAGTPVSAIGDGIVHFAGYKGSYGNLVIIKHKNNYSSWYGHLLKFPEYIKKGTKVKQGDIIGFVGSTGLATGPHLHYELRYQDKPINPFKLKIPEGKEISKEKRETYFSQISSINDQLKNIKSDKKQLLEAFKWIPE